MINNFNVHLNNGSNQNSHSSIVRRGVIYEVDTVSNISIENDIRSLIEMIENFRL